MNFFVKLISWIDIHYYLPGAGSVWTSTSTLGGGGGSGSDWGGGGGGTSCCGGGGGGGGATATRMKFCNTWII